MQTHLASWVHLGCIPLGLVLEVDFVPGERRFCLRKRNLDLSQGSVDVGIANHHIFLTL